METMSARGCPASLHASNGKVRGALLVKNSIPARFSVRIFVCGESFDDDVKSSPVVESL